MSDACDNAANNETNTSQPLSKDVNTPVNNLNQTTDNCTEIDISINVIPNTDTVLKYVYKKNEVDNNIKKSTGHKSNSINRKKRAIVREHYPENVNTPRKNVPLIVNYETRHLPEKANFNVHPIPSPFKENPKNQFNDKVSADFNIETLHLNKNNENNFNKQHNQRISEKENSAHVDTSLKNQSNKYKERYNDVPLSTTSSTIQDVDLDDFTYERIRVKDGVVEAITESSNENKNHGRKNSNEEDHSSEVNNSNEEYNSNEGNNDDENNSNYRNKSNERSDEKHNSHERINSDYVNNSDKERNSNYENHSNEESSSKEDNSKERSQSNEESNSYEKNNSRENSGSSESNENNIKYNNNKHNGDYNNSNENIFDKSKSEESFSKPSTSGAILKDENLTTENLPIILKLNEGEIKPVVEVTEENSSEERDEVRVYLNSPHLPLNEDSLQSSLKNNNDGQVIDNNSEIQSKHEETAGNVKQEFERIPLNYKHDQENNKENKGSDQITPNKVESTDDESVKEGSLPEKEEKYDENLNIKFDDISITLPDIQLPDDILAYNYEEPSDNIKRNKKPYYHPDDHEKERSKDKNNSDDDEEEYYNSYDPNYYDRRSNKDKHRQNDEDDEEDDQEAEKDEDDVEDSVDLYEKFVRERFGKRGSFGNRPSRRSENLREAPVDPALYSTINKILNKTKHTTQEAEKSGDPNAGFMWTLEYGQQL